MVENNTDEVKEFCGVIMPISEIDGYKKEHWSDVLDIISTSANAAGFNARIVSEDPASTTIHKNIVQNLYSDPIVICDVSARNPNVMLELGIRLAFDKATVIVKDDKTPFSFDTGVIQHLSYPTDLRFKEVQEFQSSLTEKLIATSKQAKEDPDYSTFMKHFGDFTIPKLEQKEIDTQQYIINKLNIIERMVREGSKNHSISIDNNSALNQLLNPVLPGVAAIYQKISNLSDVKERTTGGNRYKITLSPILSSMISIKHAKLVLHSLQGVREVNEVHCNGEGNFGLELTIDDDFSTTERDMFSMLESSSHWLE